MKIALAFWGLTRSLIHTKDSIEEKIINVLKENNIDYKIFIHTYSIKEVYNNSRAKEFNLQLDNEEYKLLNPDFIKIESQEDFKETIDLLAYRTHQDPWNTNYYTVDNFICAMNSKSKLTNMITESNIIFDYIIYLRPDVKYYTIFDLKWLNNINDNTISISNFHLYSNFNDRFALCNYNNYKLYGDTFDKLLSYSKKKELHSETFNYDNVKSYNLNINYIPFYYNRIRATGIEESKDIIVYNRIINK